MTQRNLQGVVVVGEERAAIVDVGVSQVGTHRIHVGGGVCGSGGHGGLIQVEFAEQVASQVSDIGHFEGGRRQELALDGQAVVGVVGHPEGGGAAGRERVGAVGNNIRSRRGIEGRVADGGGLQQRRILERVLFPDAVQEAVIEDSEAAANGGESASVGVVGKAEARPKVGVLVGIDV